MRSLAGVVVLLVSTALLAGCEDVGASRAAVVYGEDDRREVYAHPSDVHRAIALSAIAMEMSASNLDETDPDDVRITYGRTLGEAHDLCAGESFADQIDPGTCSGTLIDDRHILTAGHCVDESTDCDGSRVWLFGFLYESADVLARLTADDVYRCRQVRVYRDDTEADYAVIALDRPVVGHTPATLRPLPTGLASGTPLTLIGHPNGIPMKIASGGAVTRTDADGVWLEATLDAFDANSGSGVFDDAGRLVAHLDGGETDYVSAGSCNVVNVIDPPPTDDGETLTYLRPALDAFCALPGLESSACACDGPCVPAEPGDGCASADRIAEESQTLTGSLVGFTNLHAGSCGGDGPERVWLLELTRRSRVVARSSGFDTVLYLARDCDGAEVACSDDIDVDTDRGSRVDVELDPGTYGIFLDAYDVDVGAFTLDLEITPLTTGTPDGSPMDPDGGALSDSGAGGDGGGVSGDRGGCSASAPPRGGASWLFLAALLLVLRRRRDGRSAVALGACVLLCLAPLLGGCGGAEPAPEPEPAPVVPESATPASDEPSEPEEAESPLSKLELAERVFEAVQAHDFERYSQYTPNAEDLAAMLPNLSAERAEELLAQMQGTQRGMFEEAYARGEHEGIDWQAATFVGAQQNGRETRPNIFILFEHAGEPYSMKMDDCLLTPRGWIVGDYLDSPRRGESHREPVD